MANSNKVFQGNPLNFGLQGSGIGLQPGNGSFNIQLYWIGKKLKNMNLSKENSTLSIPEYTDIFVGANTT